MRKWTKQEEKIVKEALLFYYPEYTMEAIAKDLSNDALSHRTFSSVENRLSVIKRRYWPGLTPTEFGELKKAGSLKPQESITKEDTMSTETKGKLFNSLVRSNETIKKDRADRITNSVQAAFKAKLLVKEQKINKLTDKRARMLDMSTDNSTTTRNAVDDLEADGFVNELITIDEELFILNRQLSVAKDAYDELF